MSQESLHYIQYLSGIITEEQFYEIEEQQLDEGWRSALGGLGVGLHLGGLLSTHDPHDQKNNKGSMEVIKSLRQSGSSEYKNPIVAEELPRLEKRIQMRPIIGEVQILQITPQGENSSGEVAVVVKALCPPSKKGIFTTKGVRFGGLTDDSIAAESANMVHKTLNNFFDDANYTIRVESNRTDVTHIIKVNPDGSYHVEVHTYILPPNQ